jgi:hypothetical protein
MPNTTTPHHRRHKAHSGEELSHTASTNTKTNPKPNLGKRQPILTPNLQTTITSKHITREKMVLRRGTRPKRRRTEAGRTKAGREADTRRKGYGANTKKEERNGAEQNGAREPKRRRTEPDGVEGKHLLDLKSTNSDYISYRF